MSWHSLRELLLMLLPAQLGSLSVHLLVISGLASQLRMTAVGSLPVCPLHAWLLHRLQWGAAHLYAKQTSQLVQAKQRCSWMLLKVP